jgi:hypothetical protein
VEPEPRGGGGWVSGRMSQFERRLLIQSVILYVFMTVLILEWKLLGGLSVEWQAVVAEVPYICFCGLNPLLYLTMNT